MRKMELVFKNVVQLLVFIIVLSNVDSTRISGKIGVSKIQETPQYRFHYYTQDEKTREYKLNEEHKNNEKVQESYSEANSKGDIQIISYRTDKSNGLPTAANIKTGATPFKISLNNPVYNSQIEMSKESNTSAEILPIIIEPINTQEQKSSKSIEINSQNEGHVSRTDKIDQLTEELSINQTEDRKDDIKDEQPTDQVLIQDDGVTNNQTEFTIPFKKPNPVNADDFKYTDNEAIKKDIVEVIKNINGDHEQSDPQLHFKSVLSDKPLKIVDTDSVEMKQQDIYKQHHGHSNFKSQQLSNKPLRLFGFNPSTFGSLYDMQIDNNRPSQIQQPPNSFNQGYFVGSGTHEDDIKPQAYDNFGIYNTQLSSTFQTGNNKGNKKHNTPITSQQLYNYNPNPMVMLPIYTDMIQNNYPIVENKLPSSPTVENKPQLTYTIAENKPQPAKPQADSNKMGFNLMQILSGGSFYKGSEQAEGSQQMAVKDPKKQESNKLEKLKPSEIYDKTNLPQTLMFYLNPGEKPIDLKTLTNNPMKITSGQQPQTDCNDQKFKAPAIRADKPLQPIPLCSDCVPALGLIGLPNTQAMAVQQKKSITTPQVIPIWSGQNVAKHNYLILPNPITNK